MGVEIKKREYTSIFRPQDTGINWLLGNTGEWQKLTLEAEFGVFIEFDTTNSLFIDDPDLLTLTNGKSWNECGPPVLDENKDHKNYKQQSYDKGYNNILYPGSDS